MSRRLGIVLTIAMALGAQTAWATDTITVTGTDVSATEGTALSGVQVSTFTDSGGADIASDYSGTTINWGDGTTTAGIVINSAGALSVSGTHTYAEAGTYDITVTVHDVPDSAAGSGNATATVADAPLYPVAGMSTTQFSGIGGNNTSVSAGSANAAENAFKAAIGATDNGATPTEQANGFRSLNWDGVALDGTDFGGASTTIVANAVVAVPVNRWQTRGLQLESAVAVGNDQFVSVNSSASTLFPAFSPTRDWSPFNVDHVAIDMVTPSATATTPVAQATRGLGVVFLNVLNPNTTSIEYFDGNESLGKFFAPVGTVHQAEFVGELFSSPVVTRVVITLGNALIFSFDGASHVTGPAENPPTVNLVAADDVVAAEPTTIASSSFSAAGGSPFSGVVGTFSDANPNGTAGDFTATINWGDGSSQTLGTVASVAGGGFTVSGTHTYAAGGTFPASVAVTDQGGSALTLHATAQVSAPPTPPTPDTTAPDTLLTGGPTGPTKDTTPTYSFSSEAGAALQCGVDTAGFAPCTSPFTTPALADGKHTFAVRAVDAAGNIDPTPAIAAFTVDMRPPSLSKLLVLPKSVHKRAKIKLKLSEAAALTLKFAKLVGKHAHSEGSSTVAEKAGSSTISFSGKVGKKELPAGKYRLTVTPTDAAGNRGTAKTATFTVTH